MSAEVVGALVGAVVGGAVAGAVTYFVAKRQLSHNERLADDQIKANERLLRVQLDAVETAADVQRRQTLDDRSREGCLRLIESITGLAGHGPSREHPNARDCTREFAQTLAAVGWRCLVESYRIDRNFKASNGVLIGPRLRTLATGNNWEVFDKASLKAHSIRRDAEEHSNAGERGPSSLSDDELGHFIEELEHWCSDVQMEVRAALAGEATTAIRFPSFASDRGPDAGDDETEEDDPNDDTATIPVEPSSSNTTGPRVVGGA